jgi:pantoate--beta-alanine ligase
VETIHTKDELLEQLEAWRNAREHVALVPTMGNLHAGHLSLVKLAREHAERVVVSIYVNPTQFGEGEDYADYPRTLERDTRRLKQDADLLFVPSDETMYPHGIDGATIVSVPGLTENFCGASRPGHFDGVTTVVSRLFALVQPDVAIFGQKDYQQSLVIRYLCEDLNLPIRIIMGETTREPDGLAMSSRNQYLDDEQRRTAPLLHEVLDEVAAALSTGNRDFGALEVAARDRLAENGFDVDYVAVRRAQNLAIPDRDCDELVILGAATLGSARLIDNVVVAI